MHREQTRISHNRVLNKIDEFCEINIHLSFGIRELSDFVNVSYHHLGDIFVKLRGASLGSYIAAKKMERAAQLCSYTNLSLAAIAEHTGFASKHSLSKAFSNHFGITPGQMRRKSLFDVGSPNVLMDGFRSEHHYKALLNQKFLFSVKEIIRDNDSYLIGNTMQLGANSGLMMNTAHAIMKAEINSEKSLQGGRTCIRAFDSLNFSNIRTFKFFYGVYLEDVCPEIIQKFTNYIITPVKKGKYIVFDVPNGNDYETGVYITLCRESAIWYNRLFTITDFYDFFLPSPDGDTSKAGEYNVYCGKL